MEVKPGYKQSDVGVIPQEWRVVCAVDVCSKIQDGTHFSPRLGGNDYLYITSKNIRFGYLDISSALQIDAAQHRAIYKRCDVKKGDLLLTKDGANTGNAALNTLHEEFSLLSSVAFLRFDPNIHSAAYFLQQILTSRGQRQIQDAMAGNAITRLTLEKIKKLRCPVPPTKAEQEAIAKALSDADALIESLKRLIAKKRDLKQGAMQELLTGKKHLPGFSGEWSIVCMREVLKQNATYGIVTAGAFVQSGIKMLRGGDIVDGRVNTDLPMVSCGKAAEYSRTMLEKNDVVIALVGYPGAAAKIPDELIGANISRAVGLLRLNSKVFPEYLVCLLNSPDGRRMVLAPSAGSAQQVVNLAALNKLEFPIPELDEQTTIAAILSDVDAEIEALEEKVAKIRQIKQGMMQELLTGKIRLV